ncbi:proline-rich protein HaeIII subfamily 1-like [Galleria mellonella]|uniref:Proline-rich protein HaeIII subfamily 1-like n=1 Tax=Galleria mellonella TaxID=7137 RepID=A0A6J1WT93_GALME|nr:proline-rich protein HaeIII subfamily 1-like [Galleria mellonella]
MKVLLVWLFCAVAGKAAGGPSWSDAGNQATSRQSVTRVIPGTQIVTSIPAKTKISAFSTRQFINAIPISGYPGLESQFAFQPQVSPFNPFQPTYYPLGGAGLYPQSAPIFSGGSPFFPGGGSYFPSGAPIFPAGGPFYPPGSILYPPSGPIPISPIAPPTVPGQPVADFPTGQQDVDSDTTVVDSAEFPPDRQQTETQPAAENKPAEPQLPPASTFPGFPQIPQVPGGTQTFPGVPLGNGDSGSSPQPPQVSDDTNNSSQQNFQQGSGPQAPQIPQGTPPTAPVNPIFSQPPSQSPPSSFPSADNNDQGLNDEDTISVESA